MVIPGRARADRFAERPQASLDSGTSSYIDAFRAWLIRQPPATISVLAFKLLLVLLVHMDVIEQRSILLIPTYRGCFKVWRLVTSALYPGRISFLSILSSFSVYQSCLALERTIITKKEDMLYMVLMLSIISSLGCVPFRLTYSGGALGMALITLACRFNSNAVMDVMGFRVNARSAPLTIMAFNMIISSSIQVDLFIGYVIALAYTKIYYSPRFSHYLRTPVQLLPLLNTLTSLIIWDVPVNS